MIKSLTLSVLAVLSLLGSPLTASAQETGKPAPQARDSYLVVTRQDMRKCAYPMCGGYFVKAVNQILTRCADGSQQKECHAVQLDTKALGWTPEQQAAFEAALARGRALVRGVLEPAPAGFYTADQLTVTEGWQAQGTHSAVGAFYGVKSTGIVCIAAPCPSLAATKLNVTAPVVNPSLDLTPSGASDKQIEAAQEALGGTGILAAGAIVPFKVPGPGGKLVREPRLLASEFYLPAKP
ncbi:MAG: hypothetical protein QM749_00335 [Aquabacterium sp.]